MQAAPSQSFEEQQGFIKQKQKTKGDDAARPMSKGLVFLGIAIPTLFAIILIAAVARKWVVTGDDFYFMLNNDRASTQIVVQVISALLGFLQYSTVSRLINYATRIRFSKRSATLDTVYAWTSLSMAQCAWDLPMRLFVPVMLFVVTTFVPAALWAGAITPVAVMTKASTASSIVIPQFRNASLITEYPSAPGQTGPFLRTSKGVFTYVPALKMIGPLVNSAASATPVGGGIRKHPKLDDTQYIYNSRSFSAGASVGLLDDDILKNKLATSYTYLETGLRADVDCIYNRTSNWILSDKAIDNDKYVFPAKGTLPNSAPGDLQYSQYFGQGNSDGSVAIGIAGDDDGNATRKYLGIAAGAAYASLNATQCTVDFIPSVFNVSIDIAPKTINVTEVPGQADFAKDDALYNLTKIVMRNLGGLSFNLATPHVSTLGDSFNTSIADYNSSITDPTKAPSQEEATLAGLKNSVTAMVDDVLVILASAQLMIANDSITISTTVAVKGYVFGSNVYIYLVFAVNLAILLIVFEEFARTRGWKDLLYFDFRDPRSLIIGASFGGNELGDHLNEIRYSDTIFRYEKPAIGKTRVTLQKDTEAIQLAVKRDAKLEA